MLNIIKTFIQKQKVLLLIAAGVVILDKITKIWIKAVYVIGGSRNVLGNFFKITYIENHGIAFGMLSSWTHPVKYILLFIFSIIALFFLISIYLKSDRKALMQVSFGLIFGGAFGNIYDRVIYQRVIDFINIGIGQYRWPFFNIADASITIGVTILIILTVFQKEKL